MFKNCIAATFILFLVQLSETFQASLAAPLLQGPNAILRFVAH
jgi:hypothetical protein